MATYYVRADGTVTAANRATATGLGDADTFLSMAQLNLCSGANALLAGDIVYFSSVGGDYPTNLTVPAGGSGVGAEISYLNKPGETPKIATATASLINTNSKSNIAVGGFDILYSGTDAAGSGISIGGSVSNVAINNISLNMGGYGYLITSAGSVSGVNINNFTGVGGGTTRESIYFFGAANSSITLNGIEIIGGRYISIQNSVGVALRDITHTGCYGTAGDIYVNNCSGLLTIDNCSSISSTGIGINIKSTAVVVFSDGSSISNCNVSATAGGYAGYSFSNVANITISDCVNLNSGGKGFNVIDGSHDLIFTRCESDGAADSHFNAANNAYNITYNKCEAHNGLGDGFVTSNAAHDVTYNYCVAHHSGTKTSTAEGDGFTSHLTCYNIILNYCIAHDMICSGFAMVGNSSGNINNCISYNNAGDWSVEGGGKLDQIRGGFYLPLEGVNPTSGVSWTIRNNIGNNNYPREIYLTATSKSLVDMDYNCYLERVAGQLASLDSGSTNIDWDTYHETYEEHSQHVDPQWIDTTYFKLQSTSPCRNAGVDVGLTTDYHGNPVPERSRIVIDSDIHLAQRKTKANPAIGIAEYVPDISIS